MQNVISRREFIKAAGMAGAATAVSAVPLAGRPTRAADEPDKPAGEDAVPVIDTHQHLWDLTKFTLPWLKNEAVAPINRSFVTSDYLAATRGLGVVKTVYMEVNVQPSQQAAEARYVIDLCRKQDNPTAAAVIGGYPHEESFADYIKQFAESKYVRGVRTVLHDPDRPKGLCLEPRFVENMRLLGRLGLSFDLCMRPGEVIDGARLAEKCPKTRFIVDHCGNMSVTSTDRKQRESWERGIKAAAALENTVCKISGIVVTARKDQWKPADLAPNINFCLEAFGAGRVFFGGDWPVCTLKSTFGQWLAALKSIVRGRSAEFRRKLFHDNAAKFYRLS